MHIYDAKTGAWYDPNAPRTVGELVNIANELSAERDSLLKLLEAVHDDKPSMRAKVKKQICTALQEATNDSD